ncbi:GntR family transcriptional regulator [Parashewanella spongiae]|uniref:GntR family transcriptional regulator n=1 Tax=Parashewanella spongiae TaxID=342950 RepID=A0A3A6TGN8_9GAMM|nr:GntR family transcriptional regulator [Parashewanella spongiae]MCL1078500.1 GntR family transcriptional regulator [Parashewanella spongiae]RJY14707.1 GntR family transcriptional regulator [Parashewanella spongiae]
MLELLNVNPNSGEPIYRQLHEQIVRLIVGEQLHAQDVLPSVRQMAEFLAVNPMTVSRAIQQLVDQGWLERRRGQATRVAEKPANQATSGISLLDDQIEKLVEQAKQLGVTDTQLAASIKKYWQT